MRRPNSRSWAAGRPGRVALPRTSDAAFARPANSGARHFVSFSALCAAASVITIIRPCRSAPLRNRAIIARSQRRPADRGTPGHQPGLHIRNSVGMVEVAGTLDPAKLVKDVEELGARLAR